MKMVMDGEILASFFPIIWETFVVTIHNFVPNGALSMEVVKKNLINEETRKSL